MAGSKRGNNRARSKDADLLRELGYPRDLPPLPAAAGKLFALGLAGEMAKAAAYVRGAGVRHVLQSPNHWGVGIGRDEKSGDTAVVFLARGRDKRANARLPEIATGDGQKFPVREMVLSPDTLGFAYGPGQPQTRNSVTAGFTGSAISNDGNAMDGGTLTGVFTSTAGHSERGVTCAHVALGLGFQALIQNLPSSLGTLFQSPSGKKLIAAGNPNIGQPMFQLFEVDTPWPILVPIPFPIIPALTLMYIDVAAGPVRPTAMPLGLPDTRTTIYGARLSHGRFPVPGEDVYKIGAHTGLTWGTCVLSSLIVPLALPLIPVVVLFYLNMHRMAEAPRDSGSLATSNPGQSPLDIDGLGLGATAFKGPNSINPLALGVPFPVASVFAGIRN